MSIDNLMVMRRAERYEGMIPNNPRYDLIQSRELKDRHYDSNVLVDMSRPLTGERETKGYTSLKESIATKGDYSRDIMGKVEYVSTPQFDSAIPNYKTTQETILELRYK